MSNLSADVDGLKKKYREIFLKVSEELKERIEKTPPQELHKFLSEDIFKEIYEKWMHILDYRKSFKCIGCATCCKLACSEFSPDELKHKAESGDKFAAQFTSVFVPYENEDEPQKIYPEYLELLKENLKGDKVYFYHCPKLTEDNRCPDYENRPQICRDFPDNPLSLLPKACGFCNWKQEVEPTALMLHSMLEIVNFYKTKLQA